MDLNTPRKRPRKAVRLAFGIPMLTVCALFLLGGLLELPSVGKFIGDMLWASLFGLTGLLAVLPQIKPRQPRR